MDGSQVSASYDRSAVYRIVIKGKLSKDWADWFDGLEVDVRDEGGTVLTTLTGMVVDQGVLHGILARVRDLGLPLVEVRRLGDAELPTNNTMKYNPQEDAR